MGVRGGAADLTGEMFEEVGGTAKYGPYFRKTGEYATSTSMDVFAGCRINERLEELKSWVVLLDVGASRVRVVTAKTLDSRGQFVAVCLEPSQARDIHDRGRPLGGPVRPLLIVISSAWRLHRAHRDSSLCKPYLVMRKRGFMWHVAQAGRP